MPRDVDDHQAEPRRRQVDHVVAVAGYDALSRLQLRGHGPLVRQVLDARRQLGPELEHHRRALLDGLAGAHGVVQRAVHLEAHGVDVAREVRDLRRSLGRDDSHLSAARAANRPGEPFDRSRHPTAGEEGGGERRHERKAQDDSDRRVQLKAKVLETVLHRAQLRLPRVVQRGGCNERALLRDEVVTLRADAQHQRPAREDDDEVHERDEEKTPAQGHAGTVSGQTWTTPAELPGPKVDVPRVNDLVAGREVHPLVVRDRGIDVCRQHAHA